MDPTTLFSEFPALKGAWRKAVQTRENAYAPYSGFKVGAALKIAGSEAVFVGCNVGNASYGATICAERGAVMAACAAVGKPSIEFVVIVTGENSPTVPCALCLQVLAEFCTANTPIFSGNSEQISGKWRFGALLPQPFVKFRTR